MRYSDAGAFRQALEQRLKDAAEGDSARLVNARRRVLFYRLLARLTATAADRWLLKGGLALELRLPERARATRDVDLDWQAPADELVDALIEATRHDAGDFFAFTVERSATSPDRLGGSHRFRVVASLAERPFDSFQIDVGLASRQDAGESEWLTTPNVLAFADVEPAIVAAVPVEAQVAEKLHAYTRTYEGDRQSTRVKDFVDLVLIANLLPLNAERLSDALQSTFHTRDTHPAPELLPEPPDDWRPAFRELVGTVGMQTDIAAAHADVAALLEPILSGATKDGRWSPDAQRWITASDSQPD